MVEFERKKQRRDDLLGKVLRLEQYNCLGDGRVRSRVAQRIIEEAFDELSLVDDCDEGLVKVKESKIWDALFPEKNEAHGKKGKRLR